MFSYNIYIMKVFFFLYEGHSILLLLLFETSFICHRLLLSFLFFARLKSWQSLASKQKKHQISATPNISLQNEKLPSQQKCLVFHLFVIFKEQLFLLFNICFSRLLHLAPLSLIYFEYSVVKLSFDLLRVVFFFYSQVVTVFFKTYSQLPGRA